MASIMSKKTIVRTDVSEIENPVLRIGKGKDTGYLRNAEGLLRDYSLFCFCLTPIDTDVYDEYCMVLIPNALDIEDSRAYYKLGSKITLIPEMVSTSRERLLELEFYKGVVITNDEEYPCYLLKELPVRRYMTNISRTSDELSEKDLRIIEKNIKRIKKKAKKYKIFKNI